jgi:hypothetical protein
LESDALQREEELTLHLLLEQMAVLFLLRPDKKKSIQAKRGSNK